MDKHQSSMPIDQDYVTIEQWRCQSNSQPEGQVLSQSSNKNRVQVYFVQSTR